LFNQYNAFATQMVNHYLTVFNQYSDDVFLVLNDTIPDIPNPFAEFEPIKNTPASPNAQYDERYYPNLSLEEFYENNNININLNHKQNGNEII